MESPVFEAHIHGMKQGGHSVMIPSQVAEQFLDQKKVRVKVVASFKESKVEFHAALQKDKQGNFRIIFGRGQQKALGIFPTDYFSLQLFEDTSKYGVEMPEELDEVLKSDAEAFEIFESFTSGKQRSIIYSVSGYKNVQTRIDKALNIAENLKRGITDPKLLYKKQ